MGGRYLSLKTWPDISHEWEWSQEDLEYLQKNANVAKERIEAQYKALLANHPDGKISMKDFRTMLQEGNPGRKSSRMSKHIWRMYDTNRDGSIDFKEFMMVLYVMSNVSSEENLKQIFRVFDINNDGRIPRAPRGGHSLTARLRKGDQFSKWATP